MDEFKKAGEIEIGPGGRKCNCCQPALSQGKVDKSFNGRARTRLKNQTREIIKEETSDE